MFSNIPGVKRHPPASAKQLFYLQKSFLPFMRGTCIDDGFDTWRNSESMSKNRGLLIKDAKKTCQSTAAKKTPALPCTVDQPLS